jgi:hypothetical protein
MGMSLLERRPGDIRKEEQGPHLAIAYGTIVLARRKRKAVGCVLGEREIGTKTSCMIPKKI